MLPENDQAASHQRNDNFYPPEKCSGQWRDSSCDQPAQRGDTRSEQHTYPRHSINHPQGPVQTEQDARIGRDAFAALETKPDRIEMAEKGSDCSNHLASGHQLPRQQHRCDTFQQIQEQRERRQPLTPGTQHIGGPDIARADFPYIPRAAKSGEQQAKGYRTQQIAQQGCTSDFHPACWHVRLPLLRDGYRHPGIHSRPVATASTLVYLRSMILPDAPILVFDSGIGGLSVLGKIRKVLPQAPIVYSADYAGLPYGEKSEIEVATRVCAFLGRLSERYRPRLVVIACNTASTIALAHARAVLGVPIVGTVPAIKPAAEQTHTGVVGLLGTKATIRQAYVDKLEAEHADGKTLLRHAAPDLVAAAEAKLRGETPDPAIFATAIAGLANQPNGQLIDRIILGCTHFPLVQDELSKAAAESGLDTNLDFVDGSEGIARRVSFLTDGQPWPEQSVDGIFISTGPVEQIEPYRPALERYNLTQIMSL